MVHLLELALDQTSPSALPIPLGTRWCGQRSQLPPGGSAQDGAGGKPEAGARM